MTHILFPQITPNGPDPVRYNPFRDIAYNHPDIHALVGRHMTNGTWPDWRVLVDAYGIKHEDNLETLDVVQKFFMASKEYGKYSNALEALKGVGWFDLTPGQRIAYVSMFGLTMLLMTFDARRQIDSGDPTAVPNLEPFLKSIEQAKRVLAMPWWAREVWLFWQHVRRLLRFRS